MPDNTPHSDAGDREVPKMTDNPSPWFKFKMTSGKHGASPKWHAVHPLSLRKHGPPVFCTSRTPACKTDTRVVVATPDADLTDIRDLCGVCVRIVASYGVKDPPCWNRERMEQP